MEFSSFSKKKGPKKATQKSPANSPGNLFGKIALGFLQKPFLDDYRECSMRLPLDLWMCFSSGCFRGFPASRTVPCNLVRKSSKHLKTDVGVKGPHSVSPLANPSALYRGQHQRIGKRGFQSRRSPIVSPHREGHFESKETIFRTGHHNSKRPFLGWENGSFSTSKPSFRILGF